MTNDVILSVKDLTKSFGDVQVLKGIDLDVHKGEVIAIIGPSGCGNPLFCVVLTVWKILLRA